MANPWIKYIDRTYQQIKTRVLDTLHSLVPEITDHNEGNIFVKLISIWSGMVEMLNYYIDNIAREAYTGVARLFTSMIRIAETLDYQVKLRNPASMDITFQIETAILVPTIIPQGTIVSSDEFDFVFVTSESLTIPAGDVEGVIGAEQIETVTNVDIGLSNGLINQIFELTDIDDIVYESVTVRIDIITWTSVKTFAYSEADDLHFLVSVNENNNIVVRFGDGINGAIPTNGQDIQIDYKITRGSEGNDVYPNTYLTIDSVVTLPPGTGELTCINYKKASGGIDIEGIEELRHRIPKSLRTLNRAVTLQDYQDVAELYPGVSQAAILFECNQPIFIFIVPVDGGTASQVLLDAVDDWFDDKKIITTFVESVPAGEMKISLNVEVNAYAGFQNSVVQAAVEDALIEFLSWVNQTIKGELYVSDIYQVIESVDGVKNSTLTTINVIPFSRILNGSNDLTIAITMNIDNITSDEWKIVMLSASIFQLFKNNTYIGNFSVGATVTQSEVEFIVTGTYVLGDSWVFYTYRDLLITGKLILEEYSLPIADILTIQVTGGI